MRKVIFLILFVGNLIFLGDCSVNDFFQNYTEKEIFEALEITFNIFEIFNTSLLTSPLSLNLLSKRYYGDSQFARMIYRMNPHLPNKFSDLEINLPSNFTLRLPFITNCIRFYSLDCVDLSKEKLNALPEAEKGLNFSGNSTLFFDQRFNFNAPSSVETLTNTRILGLSTEENIALSKHAFSDLTVYSGYIFSYALGAWPGKKIVIIILWWALNMFAAPTAKYVLGLVGDDYINPPIRLILQLENLLPMNTIHDCEHFLDNGDYTVIHDEEVNYGQYLTTRITNFKEGGLGLRSELVGHLRCNVSTYDQYLVFTYNISSVEDSIRRLGVSLQNSRIPSNENQYWRQGGHIKQSVDLNEKLNILIMLTPHNLESYAKIEIRPYETRRQKQYYLKKANQLKYVNVNNQNGLSLQSTKQTKFKFTQLNLEDEMYIIEHPTAERQVYAFSTRQVNVSITDTSSNVQTNKGFFEGTYQYNPTTGLVSQIPIYRSLWHLIKQTPGITNILQFAIFNAEYGTFLYCSVVGYCELKENTEKDIDSLPADYLFEWSE